MFMQNFIELSASVHELSCSQRWATMLKTILPSLPWAVIICFKAELLYT